MHLFPTGLKWLSVMLLWVLLPSLARLSAAPLGKEDKPAAENSRRALDQAVSIEFADQPLQEALSQLTEQTKVRIVFDRVPLGQMGINTDLRVSTKLDGVPLRTALHLILDPYNLSYVRLGNTLLVTTEEAAVRRQLRQRVNVDLDGIPLADALKQLARGTDSNLVLDPRATKEAKATPVSMQLEDVPLETVVRLLAEVAGLKSVRIGNILFVTTDARAEKLRAEPESSTPTGPGGDFPRYSTPVAPAWAPAPGPPPIPAGPPPASPAGPPPVSPTPESRSLRVKRPGEELVSEEINLAEQGISLASIGCSRA